MRPAINAMGKERVFFGATLKHIKLPGFSAP